MRAHIVVQLAAYLAAHHHQVVAQCRTLDLYVQPCAAYFNFACVLLYCRSHDLAPAGYQTMLQQWRLKTFGPEPHIQKRTDWRAFMTFHLTMFGLCLSDWGELPVLAVKQFVIQFGDTQNLVQVVPVGVRDKCLSEAVAAYKTYYAFDPLCIKPVKNIIQ